jgi:hypothetical protein
LAQNISTLLRHSLHLLFHYKIGFAGCARGKSDGLANREITCACNIKCIITGGNTADAIVALAVGNTRIFSILRGLHLSLFYVALSGLRTQVK